MLLATWLLGHVSLSLRCCLVKFWIHGNWLMSRCRFDIPVSVVYSTFSFGQMRMKRQKCYAIVLAFHLKTY